MIEVIAKYLPLILFLVVVLAIILLFIRTDAIEKALAKHAEKTADTFSHYHKRMDGTSDTLGHLDKRLRRIEDMATTASMTIGPVELGTTSNPISIPAVDIRQVPATDEQLFNHLADLQKEFEARRAHFSYQLVYPRK